MRHRKISLKLKVTPAARKMADVEELEVQEIDLDDEDFSCEVNSDDDDATKAVEQEVK